MAEKQRVKRARKVAEGLRGIARKILINTSMA